jgi:histone H3/H4
METRTLSIAAVRRLVPSLTKGLHLANLKAAKFLTIGCATRLCIVLRRAYLITRRHKRKTISGYDVKIATQICDENLKKRPINLLLLNEKNADGTRGYGDYVKKKSNGPAGKTIDSYTLKERYKNFTVRPYEAENLDILPIREDVLKVTNKLVKRKKKRKKKSKSKRKSKSSGGKRESKEEAEFKGPIGSGKIATCRERITSSILCSTHAHVFEGKKSGHFNDPVSYKQNKDDCSRSAMALLMDYIMLENVVRPNAKKKIDFHFIGMCSLATPLRSVKPNHVRTSLENALDYINDTNCRINILLIMLYNQYGDAHASVAILDSTNQNKGVIEVFNPNYEKETLDQFNWFTEILPEVANEKHNNVKYTHVALSFHGTNTLRTRIIKNMSIKTSSSKHMKFLDVQGKYGTCSTWTLWFVQKRLTGWSSEELHEYLEKPGALKQERKTITHIAKAYKKVLEGCMDEMNMDEYSSNMSIRKPEDREILIQLICDCKSGFIYNLKAALNKKDIGSGDNDYFVAYEGNSKTFRRVPKKNLISVLEFQ